MLLSKATYSAFRLYSYYQYFSNKSLTRMASDMLAFKSLDLFKEINTFINHGCIKLIKSVIKDIYNVTKNVHFK